MEGVRRTVPRSARRSRREPSSIEVKPQPTLYEHTSGRYAPLFHPKVETKPQPAVLPAVRTGVEELNPRTTQPCVGFSSAPLSAVRWLPAMGRTALAAVGSGCGGAEDDFVSIYGVNVERGMIGTQLAREMGHVGRVGKMAIGDGVLYCGSSDGGVRSLKIEEWEEGELEVLGKLGNGEAIAGLAPLGKRVCAFGEHGSIGVIDVGKGVVEEWGMCDAVGFIDAEAVDPEGRDLIVGAGRSGEVGVWDLREGKQAVQILGLEDGMASCVTVDAAQGNFVIGGTRNGEICVWDRRVGGFTLSRARIHDGVVWEVKVVASSKPGLLLSGGEDGRVWLMDFAAASCRGGSGGGEVWRARMTQSDFRDVGGDGSGNSSSGSCGVNGVDAHASADLFAFTGDSGAVSFGSLYA